MPRLPRDLSGKELIKKLSKSWGYEKTHQTGSHVVLETKEPSTPDCSSRTQKFENWNTQ